MVNRSSLSRFGRWDAT